MSNNADDRVLKKIFKTLENYEKRINKLEGKRSKRSEVSGAFPRRVASEVPAPEILGRVIVVSDETLPDGTIGVPKFDSGSAWISFLASGYIPQYTVVSLPTTGGRLAYATNGRKSGEGVGAGTGVLCYRSDNGTWYRASDDTAVAA